MEKKKFDKFNIAVKIITYFICVLILVIVFVGINFNEQEPEKDYVRVLDVGQSDSILITSGGKAALVDASTGSQGKHLLQELKHYGVNSLDAMVLTHPHSDHIGSASYIISKMKVHNIISSQTNPEKDNDAQTLEALKTNALSRNIPFYEATEGMVIKIGNFEITVLMSDEDAKEENNRSVILMAEDNGVKFLLTGDAEFSAEQKLIEDNINFDCDVLKVGHHGSNNSTSNDFLKIATPKYGAISVGKDNSYGHPGNEAMIRMLNSGVTVLRTDLMGDIVFSVTDGKLSLEQ